jgi:integrase
MPATPSLKARKIESRLALGKAAWCVNVPAELSETGKRQRKFFATESEAKAETETLKTRRANFGTSLSTMTSARIAEANEALKLLAPLNVSLLDAVRSFVETHQLRSASIPFGQLFDLYLEAKSKRSEAYKTQLRWAKERFAALHDRLAADINVRDLDELLLGEKPTVKNAFMRYLCAVLNWGVKRDYLAGNPVNKLDFEDVVKGDTEIFEPEIVQAILQDCLDNDLALLSYRVFGFFCGVRPDGELPRLEWSDVDLEAKQVTLRAEITKRKRKRWVDLSDNAIAWLWEYQHCGGSMEGQVVPFKRVDLRDHHRDNWARVVGLTEDGKPKRRWIQQGMRHSYCSYWLVAHNNDVDTLVIQSGHESKEVMWRSYYRAATKAKARKFWSIRPPKTGKIIQTVKAVSA